MMDEGKLLKLLRLVVREEVRGKIEEPLLFAFPAAARKLGIGKTKLRELVKSGVVVTVQLGGREMVPASEIARLAHVDPPKVLPPQTRRLAASLAKLREPIPGAKEAALKVRDAKRPRPLQDSDALRRRRR